jgi:predicted nucleotidyltransferase
MLNTGTAKEIIRDFISACAENKINFRKVILFGSIVSGKNHEYSDIDLALVSDQFSGNSIKDWHEMSLVIVKDKKFYNIEPHTYTTKEFENGDDPFVEEVVKKTGIEISLNNSK